MAACVCVYVYADGEYSSESKIGKAGKQIPTSVAPDRMEEAQTQKWEKQTGMEGGFRENNWRSVRAERTRANIGEGKAKFIFAARDKSVWKANPCCFVLASVCVPYSEPCLSLPHPLLLFLLEETRLPAPSLCTSGNVSLWKLQPNQITCHSLFSAQQLSPPPFPECTLGCLRPS